MSQQAPSTVQYGQEDASDLPEEPRTPEVGPSDRFSWRDIPAWYKWTFQATSFMLAYSLLKQYMDRHELEVYLPPRAKALSEDMRRRYRNREITRQVLYKSSLHTGAAAVCAGVYFGGAYHLGQYRGRYSWSDLAVSGAAAATCVSLLVIRPPRLRVTLLGALAGGVMGAATGYTFQALGRNPWEETHYSEGWEEKQAAAAMAPELQTGAATAPAKAELQIAAAIAPAQAELQTAAATAPAKAELPQQSHATTGHGVKGWWFGKYFSKREEKSAAAGTAAATAESPQHAHANTGS